MFSNMALHVSRVCERVNQVCIPSVCYFVSHVCFKSVCAMYVCGCFKIVVYECMKEYVLHVFGIKMVFVCKGMNDCMYVFSMCP